MACTKPTTPAIKTRIPKSALMVERALNDDGRIIELVANRKTTHFWTWTGHYYQMASGPVRCVDEARELTIEEARTELDRLEALNAGWEAGRVEIDEDEIEAIPEAVEDDAQLSLF